MRMRLKKMNGDIESQLSELKLKIEKCSICNGTGKAKTGTTVTFLRNQIVMFDNCVCNDQDKIIDLEDRKKFYKRIINKIEFKTPGNYWNADINNIPKQIKHFTTNNHSFCWIHSAVIGSGKTYSLYAIKNYKIYCQQQKDFKILHENKLNVEYGEIREDTKIDGLDDVGSVLIGNKSKYLINYYDKLLDDVYMERQKLYITSNYSVNEFLKMVEDVDKHAAAKITSRMSNNITIIELEGIDRRKV